MLLLRASASSTCLETRTRSSRSARLGTQVTEEKSDRSTCQPLTPGGPRAARKHRETVPVSLAVPSRASRTACVLSIASNRFKSKHKNRTYPPQIGFLQLLSSAVPEAAPPTESVSDVKSSKLLSLKCLLPARSCTLAPSGANEPKLLSLPMATAHGSLCAEP